MATAILIELYIDWGDRCLGLKIIFCIIDLLMHYIT